MTVSAITGCGKGGSTGTAGSGGTGGTGGATTTTTATTGGSAGATTGSAGMGGTGGGTTTSAMGNHDFASAIPVDVNPMMPTAGTLKDAMTKDYYSFMGKAGERITVVTQAQALQMMTDDGSIIDPFVTIYDSKQNQIAQDDDAWPRTGRDSQVFTILPADGLYYIELGDCNSYLNNGCDDPSKLMTFDYQVFVADVSKLTAPEVNEGAEPNDTTDKSVAAPYKLPQGAKAGQYGVYIMDGTFANGTDTDVFSLTVPKDVAFDPTDRPHVEFWVQPMGTQNGDGSTSNSKLWVVSDADPTKHIGEVDQTNYADGDNAQNGPIDMKVPVTAGSKYYLFVQHAAGASTPTTDFYFIEHYVGSFFIDYQLEKSPDANDMLASPEKATQVDAMNPGVYYLDGNLDPNGGNADVDYWIANVPQGATGASLFCDAQRAGSGLRGAKFSLLKTDGTALGKGNVLAEEAGQEIFIGGQMPVAIPGGTTQVVLKVEASSQDANVVGTYYHCTVALQ